MLADDDLAANKDRIVSLFCMCSSYLSRRHEKRSMLSPARQTKMRWPQCSAAAVVFGKRTLVSEVILPLRMVARDGSEFRASEAYLLHDTQKSRGSHWIGVTSRSSPDYFQVITREKKELEARALRYWVRHAREEKSSWRLHVDRSDSTQKFFFGIRGTLVEHWWNGGGKVVEVGGQLLEIGGTQNW